MAKKAIIEEQVIVEEKFQWQSMKLM